MRLNPVLANLAPDPISEMRRRVDRRRTEGLLVIDFTVGDPQEPTPPFIGAALCDAIPAVSQYPLTVGRPELRRAISDYMVRRTGVELDPETQIIPTSGSKEAVFSTPQAFVDRTRDDAVVFPNPSYPTYERGALFAGARPIPVTVGGDFVLRAGNIPPEVMAEAAVVWSCSPHNPTGSVTSPEDLRTLVETCRAHDAMLFSDECYLDLYEESVYPTGPSSALEVAGPDLKNVLVFLSLSKRSGMTGYRCGAVVGDAEAIAAIRRFRRNTGTASPDFVQLAGAAAWADDDHARDRRAIWTAKRAVLTNAFSAVGMPLIESQAGLYMWVEVGDDEAVSGRLLDAGVVVSPGRFFGSGGAGHIRLALVPAIDACHKAAAIIVETLGEEETP